MPTRMTRLSPGETLGGNVYLNLVCGNLVLCKLKSKEYAQENYKSIVTERSMWTWLKMLASWYPQLRVKQMSVNMRTGIL